MSQIANVKELSLKSQEKLLTILFYSFSSGTLLTAALLMRAIDRKKYHAEALTFLESLKQYDSNRTGYYNDLGNKWTIEDYLADWILTLESNRETPLNLSNLKLTNLYYKQYLCVAEHIALDSSCFDSKRIDEIKKLLENCNVKFSFLEAND